MLPRLPLPVSRAPTPAASDAQVLGTVLRRFREARGLTQERLGFQARVTKNYVSDIEGARRNSTIRVVAQLLRALDVTGAEFGQAYDAARGSRDTPPD
jgi:transcriptional regulator with XRE-family HTH domain